MKIMKLFYTPLMNEQEELQGSAPAPVETAPVQETPQADPEPQEPAQSVSPTPQPEPQNEPKEPVTEKAPGYTTKELEQLSAAQLVEAVAVLLQQPNLPSKKEVERYKEVFEHQKAKALQDAEKQDLLQEIEVQEIRLKDLMNNFAELNRKRIEAQRAEREENLKRKKEVLDQLGELLKSEADFLSIRDRFYEIVNLWRSIGPMPEAEAADVQKEYNTLVERFYDLKQINDEFRAYDFKKNLEAKQELIARAKQLIDNPDPVAATKELHELHNNWKEIGPVAKEYRESIWEEFRAVSAEIHKSSKSFFDSKQAQEEERFHQKEEVCLEIENIDLDALQTLEDWNKKTRVVTSLQAKFKEIGFAGKAHNQAVFERMRAASDHFFGRKSAFRDRLMENAPVIIEQMRTLLNEARTVAESGVNARTASALQNIQVSFRQLGSVPTSECASLRKEFYSLTRNFFSKLKEERSRRNAEEGENLARKRELIEKANAVLSSDAAPTAEEVSLMVDQFRSIGFVPQNKKEKTNRDFYDAITEIRRKWKLNARRDAAGDNRSGRGRRGDAAPRREGRSDKEYLMHKREQLKTTLQTYSNNMSFLNISSKGGENLFLREIERKQRQLENEIARIEAQIADLDKPKEQPQEPTAETPQEAQNTPLPQENAAPQENITAQETPAAEEPVASAENPEA